MPAKALQDGSVNWITCRGRNGYDDPADLPDDQAAEALNIAFVRGSLGQKRYGSLAQALTGTFDGFNQLARFVPGQDDAAAELHFIDRNVAPRIMRVAAGTAAVSLTLTDAIAALPQNAHWAVLNGKLYWTYDSAVNRLHVFDPDLSTTTVRRVGLAVPAAATVANTGAGSYEAILRYYRVVWLVVSSGRVQRQSNAGASVSFTPSGTGTAARVTRPTAPGEGETHWQVLGSIDDTLYYEVSGQIAIATTTYDDTADPNDYADGEAAAEPGAFTPPPSAKFIISTGDRLVMYGAYETAAGDAMSPFNGRVWFTPVLGTTDSDDDERISNTLTNKGWIDVSRDSGAEDRAIIGPMEGQILTFQSRGMQMLISTGQFRAPFRKIDITDAVGAVSQHSTFLGLDERGRACAYFADPEIGPCRYGAGGLQWLGYDVQDIWETINLAASIKVAHGCWDQKNRRALFWIATGSSNEPDTVLAFHAREGRPDEDEGVRFGWSPWNGAFASARCSCMLPSSLGATMSRKLSPYGGLATSLLRYDPAASDDNGTAFAASITSKAWALNPVHVNKTLGKAYVQARAAAGVTIRQSLIRNYGDQDAMTADASIAAAGSETRVLRRFMDAVLSGAFTFQARLGDAAAVSNNWLLDRWTATVDITSEERS